MQRISFSWVFSLYGQAVTSPQPLAGNQVLADELARGHRITGRKPMVANTGLNGGVDVSWQASRSTT